MGKLVNDKGVLVKTHGVKSLTSDQEFLEKDVDGEFGFCIMTGCSSFECLLIWVFGSLQGD